MKMNNSLVWSTLAFALVLSLTSFVIYGILSQVMLVSATTSTNAIGGNVAVPSTCIPTVSNQLISFSSTPAGSYYDTNSPDLVTNFGNAASNIFVDGSNLGYFSNTIWVTNILWSAISGANIGTQLTNSITGADTQILDTANGGSNNIFFGSNVPAAAQPGTYSGTVNVMLSC